MNIYVFNLMTQTWNYSSKAFAIILSCYSSRNFYTLRHSWIAITFGLITYKKKNKPVDFFVCCTKIEKTKCMKI